MREEYLGMYEKIRTLLAEHAINGYAAYVLAPHVARVSLEMNHLYEDLGFRSRTQMGAFMKKNFPSLAKQKPKEKLWKKFLYDTVGEIAPACVSCSDQLTCWSCIVSEKSA